MSTPGRWLPLNRRDPDHTRCRKLLDARADGLVVTPYVVAEVCWMAASGIGARAGANVIDSVMVGELKQAQIDDANLRRISEITEIATLDRTDFSVVRPHGIEHFTLLP